MNELTLKEFLADKTQTAAAQQLGVNQSAISQMLAAGRDIRVRVNEAGEIVESYEVKHLVRAASA